MPINIVYEDPVLLGNATRDAYGLATRRANLDRTIDRQLEADKANSQLALNYEQLYSGLADRELDRQARAAENSQHLGFQREQQGRAFDQSQQMTRLQHDLGEQGAAATSERAQAAHLAGIQASAEAQRGNFQYELDAREKQRLDRINGYHDALRQGLLDGSWRPDDPVVQSLRRQFNAERADIESSAPRKRWPGPGEAPWERPVGEVRGEIRTEFDGARERIVAARERQYRAEVEAWKNGKDPGPHPRLAAAPTVEEIRAEMDAYRTAIESELARRMTEGYPTIPPAGEPQSRLAEPRPQRQPTDTIPDFNFDDPLPRFPEGFPISGSVARVTYSPGRWVAVPIDHPAVRSAVAVGVTPTQSDGSIKAFGGDYVMIDMDTWTKTGGVRDSGDWAPAGPGSAAPSPASPQPQPQTTDLPGAIINGIPVYGEEYAPHPLLTADQATWEQSQRGAWTEPTPTAPAPGSPAAPPGPQGPPIPIRAADLQAELDKHPLGTLLVAEDGTIYQVAETAPQQGDGRDPTTPKAPPTITAPTPGMPQPMSAEEFDKLPPGTRYWHPTRSSSEGPLIKEPGKGYFGKKLDELGQQIGRFRAGAVQALEAERRKRAAK